MSRLTLHGALQCRDRSVLRAAGREGHAPLIEFRSSGLSGLDTRLQEL
jgi:hypothetical protein